MRVTDRRTVLQVYGGSPKKKGSLEEYFLRLSARLYIEGYQCVFVFDRRIDDDLARLYREARARIIVVPQSDRRVDLRMIRDFRRVYLELRPVLINFHFGRSCPNGLLAARLCGIANTVWTKHSFYENGPFYRKVHPLRLMASMIFVQAHLARKVVAVSDGVRKELEHYFLPDGKVSRIYLGVSLERFGTAASAAILPDDLRGENGELVVSCVSQARPEKGLEYLIRALPAVLKECPQTRVLLLGGGPLTEELRRLAEVSGVSGSVTFCGVRNDVERILAASRFTVLPSLTEAMPLALLESQAAGKPVVACKVGGIPEVVSDGANGFLVPPRDHAALAQRMIRLLKEPLLLKRMGEESKARAALFDVNRGVEQTLELYRELTRHVHDQRCQDN